MTKKRSDKPPAEDERPPRPSPENGPGDATAQPEPGTGGLSKGEYDEAVEKAAKDVQG